jgi:hypothetical protein
MKYGLIAACCLALFARRDSSRGERFLFYHRFIHHQRSGQIVLLGPLLHRHQYELTTLATTTFKWLDLRSGQSSKELSPSLRHYALLLHVLSGLVRKPYRSGLKYQPGHRLPGGRKAQQFPPIPTPIPLAVTHSFPRPLLLSTPRLPLHQFNNA